MSVWERITTPRGYNAAKGAVDRQQEIINEQRAIIRQQQQRALGYQGLFDTTYQDQSPVRAQIGARLLGQNIAGTPWGFSTNPSLYMPTTPTLGSYRPNASLLGQINPELDIAGTGQKVYNANLASGTQGVAEAMGGAADTARLDAARRGARYLPSTGMDPGTYSIIRGQMEASNQANALNQQLGAESGMRGEQRTGAGLLNDIMRQAELDKQNAALQNYGLKNQRYLTGLEQNRAARGEAKNDWWTNYQAQMQNLGLLGGLGDIGPSAGMLSNLSGQYGNAAQGYGQLGQMQQSMWNPLLQFGGYWLGGGTKK